MWLRRGAQRVRKAKRSPSFTLKSVNLSILDELTYSHPCHSAAIRACRLVLSDCQRRFSSTVKLSNYVLVRVSKSHIIRNLYSSRIRSRVLEEL